MNILLMLYWGLRLLSAQTNTLPKLPKRKYLLNQTDIRRSKRADWIKSTAMLSGAHAQRKAGSKRNVEEAAINSTKARLGSTWHCVNTKIYRNIVTCHSPRKFSLVTCHSSWKSSWRSKSLRASLKKMLHGSARKAFSRDYGIKRRNPYWSDSECFRLTWRREGVKTMSKELLNNIHVHMWART